MFSPDLAVVCSIALIVILGMNAVVELVLRGLQLTCALSPGSDTRLPAGTSRKAEPEAFVSVHIATHDEPPELVIATLQKLANSDHGAFEVIILDNNTADPRLWQPVAKAAAQLGPRFRFFHLDGVGGAKAGALNEALARCDPRTSHVAIVDADYQVSPDFLSDAVSALARYGVDYVQFPQAYRAVSPDAIGVERELGDYFSSFATAANQFNSMLPTGTLSLFRAAALRAIGGWSGCSITEDAEIGVRLQAAGFRGIWISCERGRGLLPLDYAGLRTQRARWAAGNFQVLQRLCNGARRPLPYPELVKLVVQLTAWLSLWWLPAIALAACAIVRMPFTSAISGIASLTICGSAVLTAMRMAFVGPDGCSDRAYISALATKLSLIWTSATAWFPALAGNPLAFKRTQKSIGGGAGQVEIVLAIVSCCYALLALVYASRMRPLEMLASGLLACVWPCVMLVDRNLKASARLNPELA